MATRPRHPPPAKPEKFLPNTNGNKTVIDECETQIPQLVKLNNNRKENDVNHNSVGNSLGDGTPTQIQPAIGQTEQVVMTPKSKSAKRTIILIERKLMHEINERVHIAGGDHTGIIINKDVMNGQKSQKIAEQLSLEFRVFLVSSNTKTHSQESRILRFWFRDWLTNEEDQAHIAQDFFKELVSPKDFPRDYVGFIKKIMKLMQKDFNEIQALEVELRILEETLEPLIRPARNGYIIHCYDDNNCKDQQQETFMNQNHAVSIDDTQVEIAPELTSEKVLELIEQAYPSPITPEDLAKEYDWNETDVLTVFATLKDRGLIKAIECNSYTRIHHEDKDIKVVKQMPTIASNKQPTIAIITTQYCEKLAVDSMLENKQTFVRYTTVGESNVYTLGNIGAHRIVSTKLPSVGNTREAMTAAGNTTTRLLGTFQKVDYVFVVGVAGGIPHYTDYRKHVRLGDVVISCADKQGQLNNNNSSNKPFVYVYESDNDVQKYYPVNDILQEIANGLHKNMTVKRPWETYLKEGISQLMQKTESDFNRPSPSTDKLFMNIGNNEVIEVSHPLSSDNVDGMVRTRLHLGAIGSGRNLVCNGRLRLEFAKKYGLLATDVEISSVLDSIIGNCRESFILVKGISDYKDGTSTRKWQNFASINAAAVVKAIICGMDAPRNV